METVTAATPQNAHDTTTLADLVASLFSMNETLALLSTDDSADQKLGAPSSAAQIERAVARFTPFGRPPPPSYLAFLELHDGWVGTVGDIRLLASADYDADWLRKIADARRGCRDDADPFATMVPIEADPWTGWLLAFLDPATTQSEEMEVVVFIQFDEDQRFASFHHYLADRLNTMEQLIAEQRHGDPA